MRRNKSVFSLSRLIPGLVCLSSMFRATDSAGSWSNSLVATTAGCALTYCSAGAWDTTSSRYHHYHHHYHVIIIIINFNMLNTIIMSSLSWATSSSQWWLNDCHDEFFRSHHHVLMFMSSSSYHHYHNYTMIYFKFTPRFICWKY